MQHEPWLVLKFGGNSVSNLPCWQTIGKIVQKNTAQYKRVLIVCSALGGISNKLENVLEAAIKGEHNEILADIIHDHRKLAEALEVNFEQEIGQDVEQLQKLLMGISLIREMSPAIHAKVLSFGEIMLTKLGAAFLNKNVFPVTWCSATSVLTCSDDPHANLQSQYLAAKCNYQKDENLLTSLNSIPTDIVITQGFIAKNSCGETVLFGRGGSDTSAAYFAAKLNAARCEIWTDVPGIYTANPHQIPQARLLKSLNYDEAQEISSMGAKVLHPHCIPPLKANQIPLYVGYTRKPDRTGTEISSTVSYDTPGSIKCIATKQQVVLIQIETVQMWQQAGFLADVFQCFKNHGVSIDLISTSETTVSVTLDLKINAHDNRIIDALLADLNKFSKAVAIGPCAIVSIVGYRIRAALHKLNDVFKVFEEQKIYLVSQAANDLNLSFVVDEDQSLRLAQQLHTLLIESNQSSPIFDSSWIEEFSETNNESRSAWWQANAAKLLEIAQQQTPLYVYNAQTLQTAISKLKNISAVNQIFYAVKANNNPEILKAIHQQGIGFECVSVGEIELIFQLFPSIDAKRVLFTPNFAPRAEYKVAFEKGVHVTVDNLHPLIHWQALFKNREILLRVDPGKGQGHHRYVCTGGAESKFGIQIGDLPKVRQLVEQSGAKVIGLHSHTGSGILDVNNWGHVASFLAKLATDFPDVYILNIGGGLGITEKPWQQALNLEGLNSRLQEVKQAFPNHQLWLEPGRFLVAEAGVLLTKVTQVKEKGGVNYVGVDTGMNSLIRPALYGSYHEIVNLSRLFEPRTAVANIVGPICESGDTLGFARPMAESQEGDILLIANAGAYGRVMSTNYNLRQPAEEYFLIES